MKEFKSRLEYLKTNSTSKECKDICSTFEGFVGNGINLPEENLISLLIEKLEKIEVKDSIVTDFLSKERKLKEIKESDNLGILRTIKNIQKSKISQDPNLKYVLESYEKEINKGTPEYLLIDGYLSVVSPYKFDSIVKESVETLSALKEKLAIDLLIKESIYHIKANDNNNFFTDVVEKLNKFLTEGSRNIGDLAQDLKRWAFNPTVNALLKRLSLMENESDFKIPVNSGNCDVTKIYSPVLFNHAGGDVFLAEGTVFKTTKKGVVKLSIEEIKALPAKFVSLCEAFLHPEVRMEGENIIFYKGKNKVVLGVSEGEKVFSFNGKKYDIKNIGNHLYYSGAFNNGGLKEIEVLTTLAEGLDTIFDIDWAKTITSRVYEGAKAIVFKHGDSIYINKVNPSMHENIMIKANGTQAFNLIKDFLKYDISESLSDLLVGERAKIASLEKERKVILESINKLESELDKIEDAIATNPKIEESKEISDMKDLISDEINSLKSQWSTVETRIKNLTSIVEAAEGEEEEEEEEEEEKVEEVQRYYDEEGKEKESREEGEEDEEGEDEEGEPEVEEPGEEEIEGEPEVGEEPTEEPEGEEIGDEEPIEEPEGEVEIEVGEEPTEEPMEEPVGEVPAEEPVAEIPGEEPMEVPAEEPTSAMEVPVASEPQEIPTAVAEPKSVAAAPVVSIEQTTADSAADPQMADVLTDPTNPTQGEEGQEVIYTYNDEEEPVDPVEPVGPIAAAPVGEDEDYEEEISSTEEEGGEEEAGPEAEIGSEEGGEDKIEFDDDAEGSENDEEGEEGMEEEPSLDSINTKLEDLTNKIEMIAKATGAEEEGEEGEEGMEEEPGEEGEGEEGEEGGLEEIPSEEGSEEETEEEPEMAEEANDVSEKQKHYTAKGKESKTSKVKQEVEDKKKAKKEKEKEKNAKEKALEKAKKEKAKLKSKKDEKKK